MYWHSRFLQSTELIVYGSYIFKSYNNNNNKAVNVFTIPYVFPVVLSYVNLHT